MTLTVVYNLDLMIGSLLLFELTNEILRYI